MANFCVRAPPDLRIPCYTLGATGEPTRKSGPSPTYGNENAYAQHFCFSYIPVQVVCNNWFSVLSTNDSNCRLSLKCEEETKNLLQISNSILCLTTRRFFNREFPNSLGFK